MSLQPLIYALIFVGVFFMVEGIYLAFFGKSVRLESKVNRRLQLLQSGENREEVMETLRKEREQHRESRSIPLIAPLSEKAAQANIAFTPLALILVMIAVGVMAFIGLTLFTGTGIQLRIGIAVVM